MAINKAVAGQSIFKSVNFSEDGEMTVYGSKDKFVEVKWIDLDDTKVAVIKKAMAIASAVANYESGDETAIETELDSRIVELKDALVIKSDPEELVKEVIE